VHTLALTGTCRPSGSIAFTLATRALIDIGPR